MRIYCSTPSRTKRKTQGTPVYAGRHVVGAVEGDTFRKAVSGSKHFMRTPAGIGSDIQSLEDARKAGAVWMEVFDRETGDTYRAKIETIYTKGITRDYGFGRQVILVFDFWHVTKAGEQPVEQMALAI